MSDKAKMGNTKLDFVKMFINIGIAMIPLHHRSKIPMLPSWEPFKSRLPSHTEYQVWFTTDWCNYGVIAGWCNLAFLDFDSMDAFSLWFDYFCLLNKHCEVYPMPFIVRTSRGAHVYISFPPGGVNERRRGCDVKFHGYVVGPGCVHPNGTQYTALTAFRLIEVFSLDTILPLDLFPVVTPEPVKIGEPIPFTPTEYQAYDPFTSASAASDVDLISKVKQSVRIENLFSSVHRTSTDGRWLAALCPFHDDKHPSLWIDTRRQLCGCQVCGMKPMDVLNLYARMHNISESVAVGALARELGMWR